MLKSKIKIFFLFFIIIVLILYAIRLYLNLSHDREVFKTNLYEYLPPDAIELVVLNENFDNEKLNIYNPLFSDILKHFPSDISYPIIFSKFKNNDCLILFKTTVEQEDIIKNRIQKNIAPYYNPIVKTYKDSKIYFYILPNDRFITCSFHKGICAISENFIRVQNFINVDPENTFFGNIIDVNNLADEIKIQSAIQIFFKDQQNLFALNLTSIKDTLLLTGYNFSKNKDYKIDSAIVNKMLLDDSLRIFHIKLNTTIDPTEIEIKLNKK